jgi:hypothetical protein
LLRRNPELLESENVEFEAMTDAELAAIARLASSDFDRMAHVCRRVPFGRVSKGSDESSFADRYGADVTEAATGLMQSVFEDVVRQAMTLYRLVQRANRGQVSEAELAGMAEAAWQTFVDEMREACADG